MPASDFLKLSEVFPGPTSDIRVKELKAWLVAKGVRDFEAVPLNCDKVGKVIPSIMPFLFRFLTSDGRKPLRKSRSWSTNFQRNVGR